MYKSYNVKDQEKQKESLDMIFERIEKEQKDPVDKIFERMQRLSLFNSYSSTPK